MTSFCHINEAYTNKGIISSDTDLDKLAREVNNKKKLKSRDIYKQYRRSQNDLHDAAQSLNGFFKSGYDKGTEPLPMGENAMMNSPINYANYNHKNMSGTLIADICKDREKNKSTSRNKFPKIDKTVYFKDSDSDNISLNTPSENSSDSSSQSSSFSSISWDTKTINIDKEIKTKSKYNNKKKSKRHKCMDFDLDSVDSLESLDSGESLLRHIKYCQECKKKVLELIRKHKTGELKKMNDRYNSKDGGHIPTVSEIKHVDTYPVTKNHDSKVKKQEECNEDDSEYYTLKEIITVCLLGFLIIIILDIVMRNK